MENNHTIYLFHLGQPDNKANVVGLGTEEDCVEMNRHPWYQYFHWNDLTCEEKIGYVCEQSGK